jgi:hypothetical protein
VAVEGLLEDSVPSVSMDDLFDWIEGQRLLLSSLLEASLEGPKYHSWLSVNSVVNNGPV